MSVLRRRGKLVLRDSPLPVTPCLRTSEVPYLPLHRGIIQGRKLLSYNYFRLT